MTYKINNQNVRLIETPKAHLRDDLKWTRYVVLTPPAQYREVKSQMIRAEMEAQGWRVVA